MATDTTIINKFGNMTGWNNITVNLLGRDIEGVTELSYSDETKKENAWGAGSKPVGRGSGNYEAKASINLYKEEVDGLLSALPSGKRIQDIDLFDITVEYQDKNGLIRKDRIRNCEFMGNGVETKNNEGTITYKYELLVSHIEWNVI